MIFLKNDYSIGAHPDVLMYVWEEHKDHNVIRLLTSWATKEEDIDAFLALL